MRCVTTRFKLAFLCVLRHLPFERLGEPVDGGSEIVGRFGRVKRCSLGVDRRFDHVVRGNRRVLFVREHNVDLGLIWKAPVNGAQLPLQVVVKRLRNIDVLALDLKKHGGLPCVVEPRSGLSVARNRHFETVRIPELHTACPPMSTVVITIYRTVRANVTTSMCFAPASCKACAQLPAVAPVVKTSSMRTTRVMGT